MTERSGRLPYPSVPAVVFTIWALVVPILFTSRLLNADGDLPRHLRHGEWMLAHGSLIHTDPFSYTKGGEPFAAFEYGSQLLFALAYRAGGFAAVAVLAGLLVAASYAILAKFLLRRGVDPLTAYLVTTAAAVLGSIHWAARPHLITLVAVPLLLFFLEPGDRRPNLALLFLLFALWANLHGGFVFGLVLLAIYLLGSLAGWKLGPEGERWAAKARYYALALAVALGATMVNPLGPKLHLHIVRFFGEPFLRDNTQEFLSPDFHSVYGQLLLASFLAVVALLALVPGPGRLSYPRLLLLLANVAFALQARRNIPLYAITVFPVLALHFDPVVRALPDWRGVRAVFERDARRGRGGMAIGIVVLLMLALAAVRGRVASVQVVPSELDPKVFPVTAVARAREDRLQGRIFHEFIWGGYLLHAWPEQKVFIDGGTDFYGAELMRTYMDATRLRPGWRNTLAKWDVSLVLMPTSSPMAHELARDSGWRLRHCDATAALLERGRGAQDGEARLKSCER